eukprot:m.49395 g.49395  ORF g.49395 m.49395 type:complete len:78 (+) comp13351_c0_seq12:1529-1762(+)
MENPAAGNGAPPPKKAALKTSVWLGLPPSEHPKKTELYKYKDVDARQAHLALLTYIDLAEGIHVHCWYNTHIHCYPR